MNGKELYHTGKYYLEPDTSRSVFAYSQNNSFQPPLSFSVIRLAHLISDIPDLGISDISNQPVCSG
jgi:hypothetical protein